jgi:aerobic-type carbon monoxide dehydrogenase small subunit (CoxS/CutS family)
MRGVFRINARAREMEFDASATLLTVLRDGGYTEVKKGCGQGECGACIVLLEGEIVNACQVLAASAMELEITTTRGLGNIHHPHVIQQAFVDAGAVQCGFCTPAMVLVTHYLLSRNPDPSEEEIRQVFDCVLCRCTGYVSIIEAVKLSAQRKAHGK